MASALQSAVSQTRPGKHRLVTNPLRSSSQLTTGVQCRMLRIHRLQRQGRSSSSSSISKGYAGGHFCQHELSLVVH